MNHQQAVPSHATGPEILSFLNGHSIHSAKPLDHEALPGDHSPSVSPEQMLYRLGRFFRQYLHCTPHQLAVLSLWTLHTHCFSGAGVTPYLNICSREKESGKTLCMELLSLVCADPWYAAGINAGALVRKLVCSRPTVLLDECQTLFGFSDRKIRGLLVSGSKRGGTYEAPQRGPVDVFCPKAFAGMAILPPAIAARSIPVVLKATKPDGTTRRFIIAQAREEAAPLVAWIKQWSSQKLAEVTNAIPYTRDQMPGELSLRQQDCVEPLLHIADLISGQVPKHASAALVELFRLDSTQSCFMQLLSDIRDAFPKAGIGHRIPTSALLNFLNTLASRPWRTWHDGQPMTPVDLARILRPFGIAPEPIRLSRVLVVKGYCTRDFFPLWQHHLGEKNEVSK